MREMQLWEGSLEDAFADIHALAAGCHFRDCRHRASRAAPSPPRPSTAASIRPASSPSAGCSASSTSQARRQDELLMLQDKKKNKVVHKAMRNVTKFRL